MKNLRRYFSPGNTYFLTHVTYKRRTILLDSADLLWDAIHKYNEREPFQLIAWVILPDHWHLIIEPKRNDVSKLMKCIKLSFAQHHLRGQGRTSGRTWQNRFWDHMIRDDEDMRRHLDYVHYNPVKHGLVQSPIDWRYSSFSAFVKEGMYTTDWGSNEANVSHGDFGE